jgi:hypothetical protein
MLRVRMGGGVTRGEGWYGVCVCVGWVVVCVWGGGEVEGRVLGVGGGGGEESGN